MKHYVFIITVFTLIVSGNLSRGDDSWPGWLGPDRDGRVSGFEPPKPWPDQLTRIWQVEVGIGYGSPLISGDRIYLHTRQGEKEVIRCLNRQDGTEQWKTEFAVPFRPSPGGEFHGPGPKASPMLSGERLFTMSITGTLSAWNATTGTRLWQKNYDAAFEKSHPNWGASTSPIAEGNRVFVHFGTDKRGALVAMDAESGEEIWKLGDDGPSYSSPLIAELDGVRQLVEWNHRALVGVDIDSGKLLWEFPFPHIRGNQNMPTPVIHEGSVLLGGEGRGIHAVCPQLKDGQWTVTDRWFQRSVPLNMSTAVINGGHLYGLSHRKLCQGQSLQIDILGTPETHQANLRWYGRIVTRRRGGCEKR